MHLQQGHWLHMPVTGVPPRQDASWLHRLHATVLESASHLVAAMDDLRAVLFWQPTTPVRGYDEPAADYSQAVDDLEVVVRQITSQAEHWQVLDVRSIAKAALTQKLNLYWDSLHFVPVMYEHFNDLLLHKVCRAV